MIISLKRGGSLHQTMTMVLLALAFFGCASEDARKEELKGVVLKYNNALIEAYKSQLYERLMEATGKEEFKEVVERVSAYIHAGRIMESELKKISFKQITITDDKAEVRTSEDWTYRWVDFRTGKEVEAIQNPHYEMLYHMAKKDSRWMVEKSVDESNKTMRQTAVEGDLSFLFV